MAKLRAVGIRDLKNRLSEHLREVKAGQRILVTDRGEVVAELRQPLENDLPPSGLSLFAQWVNEGKLVLGSGRRPGKLRSSAIRLPAGTVARVLDEDRGQ